MKRFSQGWQLTKQSLALIRREPTLLVLAVLSLVVVVPVALAFGVPVGLIWEDDSKAAAVALGALGAYAVVFVAIFFAVALAAAAAEAFDGGDPGLGESIGAASKRLGPISTWALMSLTVNLVIALVQERLGAAGAILGGIAGVAWRLATFLVVPVIAFEGLGPVDALKRSAGIFRKRWGEQITGQVAVGAVIGLVGVPPAVLLIFLGASVADEAAKWS